jgi:hypothetical protein
MFRRDLALSAAVLALLCVIGMPGQLYAQRGGGSRGGAGPQAGRNGAGFDRRFSDFRFGGFGPGFGGFSPGFGGFNPGFGAFNPSLGEFSPGFGGFGPGFGTPFIDPRFGGFNPDFDRRSRDGRRGKD